MKIKPFLVILFLLNCLEYYTQESKEYEQILNRYKNEHVIYLERNEDYILDVVKNKLSIVKQVREKFLISYNTLNSIRNRKIATDNFIQVNEIEAVLFVNDNGKYKKKKINTIELNKEHSTDGGIFYDDNKYYNVSFFEAKGGDIVEISYKEIYNEPRFFGAFYFGHYYPVLKYNCSISYPNQIKVVSKEYNYQFLNFNPITEIVKGKTLVKWSFDTIKPLVDEHYDLSFKNKSSYILFNVESFKTKDSIVNIGGNLNNLYSWYYTLIENVDQYKDESITKIADSIVKGASTDIEKAKRIFYWVQSKIAYLAYEDGLGGFIPRQAGLVCNRRYGDCKDMANLIVQMCKAVNLPVYHTWIGTRDIPFQFTDFPAPFCSNHMIATYLSATDTIFMDATGRYYPFRLPTSMIQGKEGLVAIDKNKFVIAKVPLTLKTESLENDSIVLNIDQNNVLKGRGFYNLTGYNRIWMQTNLSNKSYEKQMIYLNQILQKGNNKFALDTFYIQDLGIEKNYIINYSFTLKDYVTDNKGVKYVNLNFNKDYFDDYSTVKRRNAFSFYYANIKKLIVNFELNNRKSEALPDNIKFRNGAIGFDISYSKNNTHILFKNTIELSQIEVKPNDFHEINTAANYYKKAKSNLITLNP